MARKRKSNIHVIENAMADPGDENWRGSIIKHARDIADYSEEGSELCGFVMIGMYSDGRMSVGWRRDPDRVRVPIHLMPAYVAEIVREAMITEGAACDVVNRSNGYEE